MVHSWLRNYLACMAMYFAVGSMWVYYIYWCFGNVFFGPGKMPGISDVFEQIKVCYLPIRDLNRAIFFLLSPQGHSLSLSTL